MTTIGEAVSRVRNTLKAVKEDPFLTDRTIYYSMIKYGQSLLKREDNQFRLMKISSIFKTLPYVELIDVDKIEADCVGVYSGCYFKRTKEKLPNIFSGALGPVIRTVSSIDGTIEMFKTEPGTWVSMTKSTTFKYNKRPYFWYLNGGFSYNGQLKKRPPRMGGYSNSPPRVYYDFTYISNKINYLITQGCEV